MHQICSSQSCQKETRFLPFPARSYSSSGWGAFISAGHVQTCPAMVFAMPTDVVSFQQYLKAVFKYMGSRILSRCWTLLHIYKIWSWWITWWITYKQYFPSLPLRNRKMKICKRSWNTMNRAFVSTFIVDDRVDL